MGRRGNVVASPEDNPAGSKFWKWLVFGVILALLPIGFNFLYAMTVVESRPIMAFLFGRGELLLLGVGLGASGLGDLVLSRQKWGAFKIVVTGFCVLVIASGSFYFALASGRYALAEQTDPGAVVIISLLLYAVAVISSGAAVVLAER